MTEVYQIKKLLGKGRLGGVYQAEEKREDELYLAAIRRFFRSDGSGEMSEKASKTLCNQIRVLKMMRDPSLIRITDFGADEDGVYMVVDLLDGESITRQLISKVEFSPDDLRKMAEQLLLALNEIHSLNLYHGGITGNSILRQKSNQAYSEYVFTEYGLYVAPDLLYSDNKKKVEVWDPALAAPEVLKGAKPSVASDLYSLGHVILMCAYGGHPFSGISREEALEKHQAQAWPSILEYRSDLTPAFIQWLDGLLALDPKERYPSAQIAYLRLKNAFKVDDASLGHTGRVTAEMITTATQAAIPTATGVQAPARALNLGGTTTKPISSSPAKVGTVTTPQYKSALGTAAPTGKTPNHVSSINLSPSSIQTTKSFSIIPIIFAVLVMLGTVVALVVYYMKMGK